MSAVDDPGHDLLVMKDPRNVLVTKVHTENPPSEAGPIPRPMTKTTVARIAANGIDPAIPKTTRGERKIAKNTAAKKNQNTTVRIEKRRANTAGKRTIKKIPKRTRKRKTVKTSKRAKSLW